LRFNRTIRKFFLIVSYTIIGCGFISLLIAANSEEQHHKCKEVTISIIGTGEKYFIGKSDISDILKTGANGRLINRSLPQINLANLENLLEENPWIVDAELYFDSKSVLHVIVTERQPIARVFTRNGHSFYIDSSGLRMPLLKKVSARVPVITNFTSSRKLDAKDSVLLNEIKQIAVFLDNEPFWNAQIAQVDIMNDKKFEFIPVIGSHIIRIGRAENIDQKLRRLLVFYKQVLSKTGFDKYSALDLQYEGQVVAIHKGAVSSVDSVQLKKNIAELLKAGQMMHLHDSLQQASLRLKAQSVDSSSINYAATVASEENASSSTSLNKNPIVEKQPVKTKTKLKSVENKKAKASKPQKQEVKRPKAVMPKRG
jgi:cell division protein FtsQ